MSSEPRNPCLEVEEVGDVTVARLTDQKITDAQRVEVIGDQLFGLLNDPGRKKLVLDFGKVEFLASAAVGMLIRFYLKVRSGGGKLVLCGIDPKIYEVFTITKLDRQFVICKDEQEALQTF